MNRRYLNIIFIFKFLFISILLICFQLLVGCTGLNGDYEMPELKSVPSTGFTETEKVIDIQKRTPFFDFLIRIKIYYNNEVIEEKEFDIYERK